MHTNTIQLPSIVVQNAPIESKVKIENLDGSDNLRFKQLDFEVPVQVNREHALGQASLTIHVLCTVRTQQTKTPRVL